MKKHILVVEDEISALTLLGIMLERGGFSVLKAKDADSALAVLDKEIPDLIILDVMMEGSIDGIDLCEIIRGRDDIGNVPVLILSARGDADSVMRGMEAGANDYLPKPILHHDLVRTARKMLAQTPDDYDDEEIEIVPSGGEWSKKPPETMLPRLADIQPEQWQNTLINLMKDGDTNERGSALIAMAAWHHPEKYPDAPFNDTKGQREFWGHIRHALASIYAKDAPKRWAPLMGLGLALASPSENLSAALHACMDDPADECRQWTLRILLENQDSSVSDIAEKALDDKNSNVRTLAMEALSKYATVQHIPIFTRMLTSDSEHGVREWAATALVNISGGTGGFALTTVLEEGGEGAAEAAANGLAQIANEQAIDALVKAAATRSESSVLRQVAHALSEIKDDRCVTALRKLAKSEDESVSKIATGLVDDVK